MSGDREEHTHEATIALTWGLLAVVFSVLIETNGASQREYGGFELPGQRAAVAAVVLSGALAWLWVRWRAGGELSFEGRKVVGVFGGVFVAAALLIVLGASEVARAAGASWSFSLLVALDVALLVVGGVAYFAERCDSK